MAAITNGARLLTASDRISIDERPAIVDARSHFGDWELDTIIGKDHQQASVSLTERKSRYTLIHNLKRKTSTGISKTIIRLLLPLSDHVKTFTSDSDKEFSEHKTIA